MAVLDSDGVDAIRRRLQAAQYAYTWGVCTPAEREDIWADLHAHAADDLGDLLDTLDDLRRRTDTTGEG